MKKYLSLLGMLILLAQPAFSQCGPGGCPVNQQAYQPMQPMQSMQQAPQILQQPVQHGSQFYLQSYQPQFTGAACPVCPQASPCCPQIGAACPVCPQSSQAYPQTVQSAPCATMCPNLMNQLTGAAADLTKTQCKCEMPKTPWRSFVEDYLGFDEN